MAAAEHQEMDVDELLLGIQQQLGAARR